MGIEDTPAYCPICGKLNANDLETEKCIESHKMEVRDIAKEINLYGCMHDFKETSFSEFLRFNGFEIIDSKEEYCDFEYSDCKAYLNLEIKRL